MNFNKNLSVMSLIAISVIISVIITIFLRLHNYDSSIPANIGAVKAAYETATYCENLKIFMDNRYKEQGFISIRDMYNIDSLVKKCHEKEWIDRNLTEQKKLFLK